jgi:hypothetical protein
LARHWRALVDEAEVATAGWATRLRGQGIGAMLGGLHPDVTWQAPVLSVLTASVAGHCMPGCPHHISRRTVENATGGQAYLGRVSSRGLTIVPSIFSSDCSVDGTVYPGPRMVVNAIVVPVPVRPRLFGLTEPGRPVQSLDQTYWDDSCMRPLRLSGPRTHDVAAGSYGRNLRPKC